VGVAKTYFTRMGGTLEYGVFNLNIETNLVKK